jgi:hypothetical protein
MIMNLVERNDRLPLLVVQLMGSVVIRRLCVVEFYALRLNHVGPA